MFNNSESKRTKCFRNSRVDFTLAFISFSFGFLSSNCLSVCLSLSLSPSLIRLLFLTRACEHISVYMAVCECHLISDKINKSNLYFVVFFKFTASQLLDLCLLAVFFFQFHFNCIVIFSISFVAERKKIVVFPCSLRFGCRSLGCRQVGRAYIRTFGEALSVLVG